MKEVDVYIGISSMAPKRKYRRYYYVLECRSDLGNTRSGKDTAYGTCNGVTLQAIAEAVKRIRVPCEVFIHVQSSYIANMINCRMSAWAENGFQNARGESVANKKRWEELWEICSRHTVKADAGIHRYLGWMRKEMDAEID